MKDFRSSFIGLWIATVIFSWTMKASADEVRAMIDVPVVYTGVSGGIPSWQLRVPPDATDAPLEVLREGDKVEFVLLSPGNTIVGLWNQRDRWFSHETCRKRFLRSTKCTRHYANSDCRIEHRQDPANGALEIFIEFLPPISGAQAVDAETVKLGRSSTATTVNISGPRRIRISGNFQTERVRCASLRGTAQGGPTVVQILGSPNPENWFRLQVTRTAPDLEN